MKTITKLDVVSLAKIQAVITGAMYLFVAIVSNIAATISPNVLANLGIPPGITGIIGAALSGLIAGFIAGAIIAWMYNLLAPKIGGIKIELK